jgi:hypothetical protein
MVVRSKLLTMELALASTKPQFDTQRPRYLLMSPFEVDKVTAVLGGGVGVGVDVLLLPPPPPPPQAERAAVTSSMAMVRSRVAFAIGSFGKNENCVRRDRRDQPY